MTAFGRVSGPGELHPEALVEPYVNVSMMEPPTPNLLPDVLGRTGIDGGPVQ